MTEEKNTTEKTPTTMENQETPVVEATSVEAVPTEKPQSTGNRDNRDRRGKGGKGGRNRKRDNQEPDDGFDSKIIDLARVTRVMAGGKRMSFRACVLVGDKKGRIGMGVKKGADVQLAVAKATAYAKKHLITVSTTGGTIPHTVERKCKGARVLLKPAKAGTGIIAGGPVRLVMELAGIQNIVGKIKGSGNKVNNLAAVMIALESLVTKEEIDAIKKSE